MAGGWTNQLQDEVIAPNNVPFLPGNNVTGFGSQAPAELVAAGFQNAIVFYASDWNPAATTQTIKFRFIAANSVGLQLGFGYCNNPSVSQTATIVSSQTLSTLNSLDNNCNIIFRNLAGNQVVQFDNLLGNPSLFLYDGTTGNRVIALNSLGNDACSIVLGTNPGVTLEHIVGQTVWSTDSPLVLDSAWSSIPLVNGWTGDATRVPLKRLMPDGMVQMKGWINKAANPANGEQWINALPAAYRPLHTWSFLTPTPGRAYNGTQSIEVHSDGTGVIFDMAALSGTISLDGVRYSTI